MLQKILRYNEIRFGAYNDSALALYALD